MRLEISIFCDWLCDVLLLSAILRLDFLGQALYPGRRSRGRIAGGSLAMVKASRRRRCSDFVSDPPYKIY